MSHSPSSTDFRTGIKAAVQLRQSACAFSFLQRIQAFHQQRQLSESSCDQSVNTVVELDSDVFHSVMTCALQTNDCLIVQRTFDELKATFGATGLEITAWIMLLQVCAQELAHC